MIHHHGSIPSVLDLISALSSLLLIKDCVVPAITSWQAEPLEAPNMMTIKMAGDKEDNDDGGEHMNYRLIFTPPAQYPNRKTSTRAALRRNPL